MRTTIDASVFVSLCLEEDAFHEQAVSFFRVIAESRHLMLAPTLLLAEVAGAVARQRGGHRFGDVAVLRLRQLQSLHFVSAGEEFALKAARLAARHSLRGADSFYVTVARESKTTLVTLDDELLRLPDSLAQAVSPKDWLKAQL